ncbi:unnamed protein product [Microthlaspi erraticum]|uniref:Retrotransposon gag domain-containing protein n=1 Tax=Microthlaspi erraticum TaxID=1685480 RepID=A0A6D2ITF2_9BRAS|nr:unnamed protein product [Microthlaspi erraticum]
MDGAPRGRGARGRGARGCCGRARLCGGRGRGRGLQADSRESVAPSMATAYVTHSLASEANVDASVSVGDGAAPVVGAAPAQGRDDLVVGLLTQLLDHFLPVVPQGAPGVPPVAQVQQGAADFIQLQAAGVVVPSYLDMVGHMQMMGTPYFAGGVSLEAAEDWRQRLIGAKFPVYSMSAGDEFLAEFNAKYFPREARDRLRMRVTSISQGDRTVREYDAEFSRLLVHAGMGMEDEYQLMNRFLEGLWKSVRTQCRGVAHAIQPQSQQQQRRGGSSFSSGSGMGGLPAQGQKRSREETSGVSQFPRVASVQPVAAQPVSQIAAAQSLGQIASAPRGYSSVETGGTSQTGQITGKSWTQTL